MATKHPIKGRDILSGEVEPQDCTLDIKTRTQTQMQNQKPWRDIGSLWVHAKERTRRLGVRFHKKSRRPLQVLQGHETLVATMPQHTSANECPIHSLPRSMQNPRPINLEEDAKNAAAQDTDAESEGDNQVHDFGRSLPSTAMMAGRLAQQKNVAETEHVWEAERSASADRDSGADPPGLGYIPPETPSDCREFASSAVTIKTPSGEHEAMKLFYDTMPTDNWASERFVKSFGYPKRPILPDDLHTYVTVKGDYTPTHYIEIELRDRSRGMKEFVKISLNVTPSMDGIGLIAGVDFMRKNRIRVDVTAPRDSYVATSRKANKAAKEAQKLILEKAKRDAMWANQLSGSTAGPSTLASGPASSASSKGQPLVSSSRTSISSGARSDVSKET